MHFSPTARPSYGWKTLFASPCEIESSEIDAIYSKLTHLGGPHIAKTMENLGCAGKRSKAKTKVRAAPILFQSRAVYRSRRTSDLLEFRTRCRDSIDKAC